MARSVEVNIDVKVNFRTTVKVKVNVEIIVQVRRKDKRTQEVCHPEKAFP